MLQYQLGEVGGGQEDLKMKVHINEIKSISTRSFMR